MTMTLIDLLPLAAAVLAVLRARLIEKAQPLRLRMATAGEALLASADLPTAVRRSTEHMLNHAFGSGIYPIVNVFLFPITGLGALVLDGARFDRFDRDILLLTAEQRTLWTDILADYGTIRAIHHPLAHILLSIEVFLITMTGFVFSAVLPRPLPNPDHVKVALGAFEASEMRRRPRTMAAA
jgi:hypothetical protein